MDIFKRRTTLVEKEYLLQNLVFTLLTLYSNNPKNCNMLEEAFNFLPTMIVSFPAICSSELSASILKLLNYVCQCVEQIAPPSIAALCAVAVVLLGDQNLTKLKLA